MPKNAILEQMLDRLYASMVRGPSLNCRPHSSRQRVDLTQLARFQDLPPQRVLPTLLGAERAVSVAARVPMPPDLQSSFRHEAQHLAQDDDESKRTEESPAHRDWRLQKALLSKLRSLSEDARTYEQDTGVHALSLGYPLLSMPPGAVGGGTQRILAPIAFIPVSLATRTGHKAGVDLACHGEGVDVVTPNPALLAWLERQTGVAAEDLLDDEEGEQPWHEIAALIEHVVKALQLEGVNVAALADASGPALQPVPKAEDLAPASCILPGAVLGLYPMANQSLLRDTREMIDEPALSGPVCNFIESGAAFDRQQPASEQQPDAPERQTRRFADERLVTWADPFQAATVALAREATGLVIHGPPGTGKSQTITNIIGDVLARGERVLFVCDKRTALDVVFNRLEHLGLADLCALVHDPQRDQRDLYMSIRARLEDLTEARLFPHAQRKLDKIDQELQQVHTELSEFRASLMEPDGDGACLHDLMGRWLSIEAVEAEEDRSLRDASLSDLERLASELEITFQRGVAAGYSNNPWAQCAGLSLQAILARPMDEIRRAFASCVENGRAADATLDPSIPPFNATQSLAEQASRRTKLADDLQRVLDRVKPEVAKRCAEWDSSTVSRHLGRLRDAQPHLAIFREGPLDAELHLVARDTPPSAAAIAQQVRSLDDYLRIAGRWHAFLAWGLKRHASRTLAQYGLPLSIESAQRLRRFLFALRARMVLSELDRALRGLPASNELIPDDELDASLTQHQLALELLASVAGEAALEGGTRAALQDFARASAWRDGLRRSEPRAAALEQLETSLGAVKLFDPRWLEGACVQVRGGRKIGDTLTRLEQALDTLEVVLRIKEALAALPEMFRAPVARLLREGAEPAAAIAQLSKSVLAGEIARRLAASPRFSQLDSQRLAYDFERYRTLEAQKQAAVREVILHLWRSRQKERLLASTGSRLSAEGAKLRQRLFVRGQRAMRLRQVVAVGRDTEGGDPLFDICPVWMASPQTVAQVFPRQPLFDTVVFDEASQCKLEEALPVLTRGKRVVIAGDPKQLPPTRFFESAITASDDDPIASDQDLFEAQQAEVEDLLAAALNLDIHESHLNVHYRSRNADLIEFSNDQFYGSRLQAIPGHPANRTQFPPITLHRVDGVYEDRANEAEAQRVVQIVHDLLRQADPPSIGVACFNLVQRDLIVEMLDERAAEDKDFARRLAAARQRRGEGSFEGLFVKNLENVQGDERDHIIISTTYGPGPDGKFHRRFGPLGASGGGRRLNVLVTRARHEVHLVTSIPREAYLAHTPIPDGQTPNGGWLLFAYLRYAEELAGVYEQNHRILSEAQAAPQAQVHLRPIGKVSDFAVALGRQLATERNMGSEVHWGNEGFRVELAVRHPNRAEDVTVGVLCDFASFEKVRDPVEWDMFRTAIHESQGWTLHRLWTPEYFRDPQRSLNRIQAEHERILMQQASRNPRTERE